jgi:hypothetical protein
VSGGDVGPLRVRADLRLAVEGVDACVVGDGSRLTMSSNDVPGLFTHAAAASSATGLGSIRESTRRVGALLDGAGLSLAIVGGRGTVVALGADCRSGLGRAVLGSDHVRLGSARSLAPVLAAYARSSAVFRGVLCVALVGAAVAARSAAGRRTRP